MRSLLDVNLLIALMDQDHAFHSRAHAWWSAESPAWASCPLTENGLIRIMSSAAYSRVRNRTVFSVTTQFEQFSAASDHEFWDDSISVCNASLFDHRAILSSKTLTNLYLLGLATTRGGRLVTFDQGVSRNAVHLAEEKNLLVL